MKQLVVLIFLCVLLATCFSVSNATEYRAVWIDGWHSGMWTASEIDTMLSYVYNQGHYNVIVPQIRKKADALYNSTYGGPNGTGEPKPDQVQPPSFDPLAYMIQKAHEKGIKVYPWVCTHRCPTTTTDWFYVSHPDWLTRSQGGTSPLYVEGYWLDPGHPDGEEYTINVILDIVKNYDIDGIQWDRIRYPQLNSGYNPTAIARFQAEKGYYPSYSDSTFTVWRKNNLNAFVARAYAQIMEIKPHIVVGANTWPEYSSGNSSYLQDWNAWMFNHWLDINVPMNYTSNNTTFTTRLQDYLNRRYGRYVYSGLSVGESGQTLANACTQIGYCRTYNQGAGIPWGSQTYSYYHGTVTLPGWFQYVAENSSRPYYNIDNTLPSLPWKSNPDTGIIHGRVTKPGLNDPYTHDWVYRAYVTIYHPGPPDEVYMSTYTDQTGYYVFMDVPPRSGYTITAEKAGMVSRSYTNQTLKPGEALREDFQLSYTTCTSPPGTVVAGWNLISLPLDPVNTNPATVFSGIDIDLKLFRYSRTTWSFIVYDQWSPGDFGPCKTDEGYWLLADGPKTISYQAYAGGPTQRSTTLGNNCWNIIGCPFTTDKNWENAEVTHAGTTVPLRIASKENNWLDSVGWWWDNLSQSLQTLGLSEDWPATDCLQPWHGYWVKTNTNDVVLTLR
ncbi:MAG: family 10 glycosylhydrolase [Armatimonadota bacterium]|nr:family 10 glycosylhydrolase [Armatimonadota bacterium]